MLDLLGATRLRVGPASWAEHPAIPHGVWFKQEEGDYVSLHAWLGVVSWITDDLVPYQGGRATRVCRHLVSANSPQAQALECLPVSEIQELESNPHQLI